MKTLTPRAKKQRSNRRLRPILVACFIVVFLGLFIGAISDLRRAASSSRPMLASNDTAIRQDILGDINEVNAELDRLNGEQKRLKVQVFDIDDAYQATSGAEVETQLGEFALARKNIQAIRDEMRSWQATLDMSQRKARSQNSEELAITPDATPKTSYSQIIPILIYHKTPADFERQLQELSRKGYRTTTLTEVANGLRAKRPLPGKPVVITFDDGFADQLKAFSLLQKYSMKATFYVITGGQASHGCIGANRTNTTCGDSYLNWDQIRMLDSSGLITIGAHTVDHLALASQPAAIQDFQIRQSKAEIERQLGHSITDFAYPYGSFTATTLELVKKDGFSNAVSTLAGITQSPDWIYALRRTRSVEKLP